MHKSIFVALALVIVVGLSGCGQILEKDQTAVENKEWLDFHVLAYQYQDYDVYWSYEYREGILGISTPKPLRSTRQVVYLKNGKIVKVEELGSDREKWIEVLKEHGIKWHEEVFAAVEKTQVIVGMTLDQVMFSLGHPQLSPPWNYKVTRHREDISPDDKLYYPMYRIDDGYLHVVMRDGLVVDLEGASPGTFQKNDKFGR